MSPSSRTSLVIVMASLAQTALAQIAVTPNGNPADLAQTLFAQSGLTPTTFSASSPSDGAARGTGIFTAGPSPNPYGLWVGGPAVTGVVLSNGDVQDYVTGPNLLDYTTTEFLTSATASENALLQPISGTPENFDIASLKVTFSAPAAGMGVDFVYVFGSEEYPEYQFSQFIDAFGIYLNGTNIAKPGFSPCNAQHPSIALFGGTELDGVIVPGGNARLIARGALNAGANTVTLIIGDAADYKYDSTSFVYISCVCAAPPTFVIEPQDAAVVCGQGATFAGFAEGCHVTYQWEAILPGGGLVSLGEEPGLQTGTQTEILQVTAAGAQLLAGSEIRLRATNACGDSLSAFVSLSFYPADIASHPVDVVVCPPEPASFSVSIPGSGLTYQWWKQCPGAAPIPIQGATGSTLSNAAPAFWTPQPADCECEVYCVISKPNCGSVTSDSATIHCCDCVLPPANMAMWLPFDETSGTIARNVVGPFSGLHVSSVGGPYFTNGMVDGALFFSGQGDSVRVTSHGLIDIAEGDLSIDAWILISDYYDEVQFILDKRLVWFGATPGYSLYLVDGQLGFQLSDGDSSSWVAPGAAGKVPTQQWTHVAVTVDRDQPDGGRLYRDGALVLTFDPTSHQGSLSNSEPLRVGASSSGLFSQFVGRVDEVELFRRALGADEVSALAAARGVGKCKRFCQVIGPSIFCKNAGATSLSAWVFNATPFPASFTGSFVWQAGLAACSFPGPFPSPISQVTPFSTSAWGMSHVTVAAPKPPAMTVTNDVACFRATFVPSGGKPFACNGTVVNRPDISCYCPNCNDATSLPLSESAIVGVGFANDDNPSGVFPFRIDAIGPDMQAGGSLMINGQPPGTAYQGTAFIPMGAAVTLNVEVSWAEVDAIGATVLILSTDMDGDGTFEPVATRPIFCVAPGPPPDLDGNGVVDGGDLGALLSMWGSASDLGDLVVDGIVDGADLGILMASWGSGG